jgi:sporulation protein YlmC with PRC-barrel domain
MISFCNQLSSMTVCAREGEVGQVGDLMFDVFRWRVLYVQVSTGWLFGRDVLVPVGKVDQVEIPCGPVHLALNRHEIEASPAAADFGSLDEGYEKELFGYYGLTDETGAAVARTPPAGEPLDSPAAEAVAAWHTPPMAASLLNGYRIEADGDIVGHVCDLVIDLKTWHITSLTADLGGYLVTEYTDLGIGAVAAVDRDERLVHMSISKDRLQRMPRLSDDELSQAPRSVPPWS